MANLIVRNVADEIANALKTSSILVEKKLRFGDDCVFLTLRML